MEYKDADCPYCVIEYQQKQLRTLADAVLELSDMLADWSAYASEYFADKYKLDEDLKKAEEFCVLAREVKGE